jgi:hypothetical protein
MAREAKVSKSTVQRVWSHNEIKPHRLETFKISNDPNYAKPLRLGVLDSFGRIHWAPKKDLIEAHRNLEEHKPHVPGIRNPLGQERALLA